ncbi:GCN5-related N-acetyltransferase [Bacillus sp. JCM 19046]|nr:GCN5-related N-acetyltransferase [Bacillus sp. JCM 19045]GAF19788.1 GCN5-related N-acetyltransferase [Bacillus sp. JCM 19046]
MIRKATMKDCKPLSVLAYRSKAYWGYSDEFMASCKTDLEVNEEDIEQKWVYLAEEKGQLQGFYCLEPFKQHLDALFIDPDSIGNGLGKVLWQDLLQKAKENKIKSFTLDSEPHATPFYEKMGAIIIGETTSSVFPERTLPLMQMKLET